MSPAEKIKEAVWRSNSFKAPGYNGITFNFIKKSWSIIGDEIHGFVTLFLKKKS